uniref:Uncharacterized protein n=1 Tax=Oryza brachyantha TaxID=4533 RepID=J3LH97_ORYBR
MQMHACSEARERDAKMRSSACAAVNSFLTSIVWLARNSRFVDVCFFFLFLRLFWFISLFDFGLSCTGLKQNDI